MNFWIPFLLGIGSCAASLGVWLFGHCLRLAGERDDWMRQAHELARILAAHHGEQVKIVRRGGIPVLMPIEQVEWPEELEVKQQ